MRTAILREYGQPLDITTVPAPEPDPDGVVVEIEACGLCRSDWHAWQGHGEWNDDQVPTGQVLGHEPAGTVAAVGDHVERFAVGDCVVVPFSLGDGTCHNCRSGHGNVCENGLALGFEPDAPGAFAEQVAVPEADYNLVRLPEELDPRDAAVLGCRYMTAYHGLVDRAGIESGDWLAVHGCGGVGLSAVQLGDALGARVVAVDPSQAARDRARDLGAQTAIDPEETDPVAAIRDQTGGADLSVDALGIAETCQNSVRCLRERGTHLQLGLTTDAERGEVALPTDWMTRWEISFLGSRGMPPTQYGALFDVIAASDIDPGALVGREIGLEAVSDRLAAMGSYETAGVEVITSF
ncbi:alcohol dehydrogenase [Halovenus aranensis]|uniref:Alcohol dehydrogenase n=1 Tax=Halovenus aranensis TaxID=890420 RepID=A0A1G8Y0V6_9EURY|nr:zinc-dependent alcohol dehydrogenase family protein [Halovenus aranensis]SDJ96357.1 alcohol dehydrogenase [Halovenus aranensis]